MEKNNSISFLDIESIPQLIKDFLMQKVDGFGNKVFNDRNIEQQFQLKAQEFSPERRKILFDVLQEQYSGFKLNEKQEENLNSVL